jgi:uncharacterized protein (DUF488 family)
MKKPSIFTIGHSTRSIDEFVELLRAHEVGMVVDVRTIPKSRHNPQFNQEDLKQSLRQKRIRYIHIKTLGGLRHAKKDSTNLGWRNTSFRGFADYMATSEFRDGLEALMKIADQKKTAIMCAEAVPWRCHRSLIADALVKEGWVVRNIMTTTSAPRHRLTPFLKMKHGQLIYPEPAPTK